MSLSTRIILNVTHNQPYKEKQAITDIKQPSIKSATNIPNFSRQNLNTNPPEKLRNVAFTGIIQGLKDDNSNNNDIQRLQPHLQFIFQFLSQVANDKDELSDSLLSSSVGLIGDISMSFGYLGNQLVDLCKEEPIQFLLNSGIKSKNDKTKILRLTTHNSLALFARYARSLACD